jgi:cytochrome c-type biogenesis protein CcmH/NrfF
MRCTRRAIGFALLTITVMAADVWGRTASLDQHELEARQLERQLVAPCCWRQQVAVHDSAIAREIRQDIRVRLARGETPQHVRDAYVRQYGVAILVEPPASGYGLPLYILPPVVLLLTGALLVVVVRRFTRRSIAAVGEPPGAAVSPPAPDAARRLDDDLASLD